MTTDRYLKGILTIIAFELGWLALTLGAQPIAAQRQGNAAAQEPMPVVITGVQMTNSQHFLPVGVMGQYRSIPVGVNLSQPRTSVEQVAGQDPLRTVVDTSRAPLRVDLPVPIVVHVEPGSRPIRTEEVPFTPRPLPGQ